MPIAPPFSPVTPPSGRCPYPLGAATQNDRSSHLFEAMSFCWMGEHGHPSHRHLRPGLFWERSDRRPLHRRNRFRLPGHRRHRRPPRRRFIITRDCSRPRQSAQTNHPAFCTLHSALEVGTPLRRVRPLLRLRRRQAPMPPFRAISLTPCFSKVHTIPTEHSLSSACGGEGERERRLIQKSQIHSCFAVASK
jgi:hypothetical protein